MRLDPLRGQEDPASVELCFAEGGPDPYQDLLLVSRGEGLEGPPGGLAGKTFAHVVPEEGQVLRPVVGTEVAPVAEQGAEPHEVAALEDRLARADGSAVEEDRPLRRDEGLGDRREVPVRLHGGPGQDQRAGHHHAEEEDVGLA